MPARGRNTAFLQSRSVVPWGRSCSARLELLAEMATHLILGMAGMVARIVSSLLSMQDVHTFQ